MLSGGRTRRTPTNIVGSLNHTLALVCRHEAAAAVFPWPNYHAHPPPTNSENRPRPPTSRYYTGQTAHRNMRDLRFVRAPQKDFGDALIPEAQNQHRATIEVQL